MSFKPWEGRSFREKFEYIKKQNKLHSDHDWRTDDYSSKYFLMKDIEKCLKKDWEENSLRNDGEV